MCVVRVPAHFPIPVHGHYEILKLFKRLKLQRGREEKGKKPPLETRRDVRRCKLTHFALSNRPMAVEKIVYRMIISKGENFIT